MRALPNILIIDDNPEVLKTLSAYFTKKNFTVSTAANGLDGLKIFESQVDAFDLVITDLVMPNISGVGIISILKGKRPEMPVIAITGYGEYPEALAKEARADVVLDKPIKLSKLEDLVKSLILAQESR